MDNLLAEAAKLLAANTKLNVTYTHHNARNAEQTDGQLTITHGNQKHTWCVEAKERLTRHRLHKLQLEKAVFRDEKKTYCYNFYQRKHCRALPGIANRLSRSGR